MNHIRSLYGRFFLRIMAVCFLLAGLLFVAAASIRAGNSQLSVCLILIAAAVLLLFSAILLAALIRAAKLRNSSENSQDETRLSFLTDLLNDEHYLGYSRQELASEMLKTQAQMNSLQSQINPHERTLFGDETQPHLPSYCRPLRQQCGRIQPEMRRNLTRNPA